MTSKKVRRVQYGRGRHKFEVRIPEELIPESLKKPLDCQSCHDPKIKKIDTNHWKYAYAKKQVKENPLLALDYTCYVGKPCHDLCDHWRNIADVTKKRPDRALGVWKLMPDYIKEELLLYLRLLRDFKRQRLKGPKIFKGMK